MYTPFLYQPIPKTKICDRTAFLFTGLDMIGQLHSGENADAFRLTCGTDRTRNKADIGGVFVDIY